MFRSLLVWARCSFAQKMRKMRCTASKQPQAGTDPAASKARPMQGQARRSRSALSDCSALQLCLIERTMFYWDSATLFLKSAISSSALDWQTSIVCSCLRLAFKQTCLCLMTSALSVLSHYRIHQALRSACKYMHGMHCTAYKGCPRDEARLA